MYCIRATGTRDNRGWKAEKIELQQELENFYNTEFKPLLAQDDKHDLRGPTSLLPYLASQMRNALENNLKEHFITRLLRFINLTAVEFEQELSAKEAKEERKLLKDAVISNNPVPRRYSLRAQTHRARILPKSWDESLRYDVKGSPFKYLVHSFYMNSVIESAGHKLFQPMSLRSSIVPHYITIDTAAMIKLLPEKGNQADLLKNISAKKNKVWSKIFKMNKQVFRKKNFEFNHLIQTDGMGVSLIFKRVEKLPKRARVILNQVDDNRLNINQLSNEELEDLKGRNIVGADPGKFNLVYMVDSNGTRLRYTVFQRRAESMQMRNERILQTNKRRAGIAQAEAELSHPNSKSVDCDRFITYSREKNLVNHQLHSFYEVELYRKMKWRSYVYRRKSEDRLLNQMEKSFGKDAVIAYGDWSRPTQMRGFSPTLGKGMRKIIERRFQVVGVNEFRTSKLCCECHDELSHLKVKHGDDLKKVFRCLVCKGCGSSKSKGPVSVTRDLNSAMRKHSQMLAEQC